MRSSVVAAMALALVACSDETSGLATSFEAGMLGSWEVPPVTTSGSGYATFTVGVGVIDYEVTYSGLSGAPTAAHIHIGDPDETGDPVLTLCSGAGCPATASGTISGSAPPDAGGVTFDELVDALRARDAYVNVHTAANGGGEIRGQIVRRD